MSSINKVILVGRLGHDPSLRTLPDGGVDVCELSVATDHKAREGAEPVTTWHKVIVYGRPGTGIAKIATKGSQVYIEGRINHRPYVGRDKVEKVAHEIIADRCLLLGSKAQHHEEFPPAQPTGSSKPSAVDVARETAKKNIKQSAFSDLEDDIPF